MQIGSLLGGFSQGLGGGVDIASKLALLRQQQHDIMARQAMGQALAGGGMGGPGGAPAMPPGMPSPAPQAPGGAGPAMDGPTAMPPAPSGMVPDGAPPLPNAPPPSSIGANSPPPQTGPAPPAAATGAGGAPLSGAAAGFGYPVKDAQTTIQNIATQIKAANPNIRPEELFNATNLHIEQMKGVRNDVRDYMQQQVALAGLQYKLQASENRLRGVEYTADQNYRGRTDAADIRGDAQRDVATTQAGARTDAARITGGSREAAAKTAAGARVDAATIGGDSRRDVATTNAGARGDAARQERAGRENAASFQSGAAKPKLLGYDAQGNAMYAPAPGGGGGAPKPAVPAPATTSGYKSAADVRAAYQAGKLTHQQATTILQRKFGMQ